MAASVVSPNRRVLHSWKEISAYTGRGVRTVQRYEVQFGFPVHRPAGSPRSAVLAFTDEVDRWLAGSPTRFGEPGNVPRVNHDMPLHSVYLKAQIGAQRAHSMQERLLATKALLDRMYDSLQKNRSRQAPLTAPPPPKIQISRAAALVPSGSA